MTIGLRILDALLLALVYVQAVLVHALDAQVVLGDVQIVMAHAGAVDQAVLQDVQVVLIHALDAVQVVQILVTVDVQTTVLVVLPHVPIAVIIIVLVIVLVAVLVVVEELVVLIVLPLASKNALVGVLQVDVQLAALAPLLVAMLVQHKYMIKKES